MRAGLDDKTFGVKEKTRHARLACRAVELFRPTSSILDFLDGGLFVSQTAVSNCADEERQDAAPTLRAVSSLEGGRGKCVLSSGPGLTRRITRATLTSVQSIAKIASA